jgi:hypothetical protein
MSHLHYLLFEQGQFNFKRIGASVRRGNPTFEPRNLVGVGKENSDMLGFGEKIFEEKIMLGS